MYNLLIGTYRAFIIYIYILHTHTHTHTHTHIHTYIHIYNIYIYNIYHIVVKHRLKLTDVIVGPLGQILCLPLIIE